MKIFTIIVTYNGMQRDWIQKSLDSLVNSSIKTEIIVIDNGSIDETINFIQKNYPQVDLIVANENLGFAKANNIGIKKSYEQGADYVFLLNQDAWVEKDTLENLVNAFQQLPDAGIVSPMHLNGSKTNLDYGFVNSLSHNNTSDFISDLYFKKLKTFYETQFVNAAAWLISRECIEKVGGFDTSIFYHYGEDVNYVQRVIYHGLKVYIASKATIAHDREDRKGKWSIQFQRREEEINRTVYFANILLEEKILDNMIFSVQKRLAISYIIKRLLLLKFKNILEDRKKDKKDMNFYLKIKDCRKKYKQSGMIY